jgi:hypothetical protein
LAGSGNRPEAPRGLPRLSPPSGQALKSKASCDANFSGKVPLWRRYERRKRANGLEVPGHTKGRFRCGAIWGMWGAHQGLAGQMRAHEQEATSMGPFRKASDSGAWVGLPSAAPLVASASSHGMGGPAGADTYKGHPAERESKRVPLGSENAGRQGRADLARDSEAACVQDIDAAYAARTCGLVWHIDTACFPLIPCPPTQPSLSRS